MSEKTFFFVKREIPLLFFVNCERADLFFVKRDLYPPFTTLFIHLSCKASSRWKNYRPRRSKVFSSFKTNNHMLFPVTHIGSPFGISLQANARFPYHFTNQPG